MGGNVQTTTETWEMAVVKHEGVSYRVGVSEYSEDGVAFPGVLDRGVFEVEACLGEAAIRAAGAMFTTNKRAFVACVAAVALRDEELRGEEKDKLLEYLQAVNQTTFSEAEKSCVNVGIEQATISQQEDGLGSGE